MNFLTLVIIVLAVLIIPFSVWHIVSISACKGETTARFHHAEPREERDLNGRMNRTYYVPYYEYEVGNRIYTAEAIRFANDPKLFEIEAPGKVRYHVSHPERCFVNGVRCRTASVREKPVDDDIWGNLR